jgi:hypothetical protein
MSALQAGREPPPPSLGQLYRTHGVQAHDRSLETRRISIAGKPAGWQGSVYSEAALDAPHADM